MTAVFGNGIDISFEAWKDMGDYQYHFVGASGSAVGYVGKVYISGGSAGSSAATGSDPGPLGVLQNDPQVSGEASVRMVGSTQLYVNAGTCNIYFGGLLTCASDSHGESIDSTATAAGSAIPFHAISLAYTTSDGVLIEAFVRPWGLMSSGS